MRRWERPMERPTAELIFLIRGAQAREKHARSPPGMPPSRRSGQGGGGKRAGPGGRGLTRAR